MSRNAFDDSKHRIPVVHFSRRPGPRNFSIERLFADIRNALPPDVACREFVAPELSRGIWPRLKSTLAVRSQAGLVNHVLGDTHFLALGLPGARTILTIHDCGNLHRLDGFDRAALKYLWFTAPCRHVRCVTAISEATKQELVKTVGIPAEKIRVIHNCVSPHFVPYPFEFDAKLPKILLLGTAPNKNLQRIAAALAGLTCAVELIGRPRTEDENEFQRHGVRLRSLGSLDDRGVIEAYRRCDLVLFPSTLEGFGLPILEAQATGRPVVTSNCSSMPEAGGQAACYVDPWDVASIRAGVDRVIADRSYREALIEKGFKNVTQYSPLVIASEYAALYREVAGRRGAL